jgi:hypothetical protein
MDMAQENLVEGAGGCLDGQFGLRLRSGIQVREIRSFSLSESTTAAGLDPVFGLRRENARSPV